MADLWRAWFTMRGPEESDPLSRAALSRRVPVENYAITPQLQQDGSEMDAEASFDLTASNETEARLVADDVYGKWRMGAGLDPGFGELIAIGLSEWARWDRFLSKAHLSTGQGRYEEAVVFAQIACEVR